MGVYLVSSVMIHDISVVSAGQTFRIKLIPPHLRQTPEGDILAASFSNPSHLPAGVSQAGILFLQSPGMPTGRGTSRVLTRRHCATSKAHVLPSGGAETFVAVAVTRQR